MCWGGDVVLKRLASFVLLAAAWPLAAQSTYVIATSPGTDIGALSAEYSFSVLKSWRNSVIGLNSVSAVVPFSATALAELKAEPGVVDVESNAIVQNPETETTSQVAAPNPGALPNLFGPSMPVLYYGNWVLPAYITQPSAQLIRLTDAQYDFGGGTGIVAIIDTGVDTGHPGLQGSLVPGFDFTRNRPDTVSELYDLNPAIAAALAQGNSRLANAGPTTPILSQSTVEILDQSTVEILDQSTVEILDGENLPGAFGHGTMMAGLVHLIAPQAQIMPLKSFRPDGSAQLADIAAAIFYAADNGADVLNMSFGFASSSPLLSTAIAYAANHGVILVSSAGNAGQPIVQYPGGYSSVVDVGSTTLSDQRSTFSNYGNVNAAAPGEGLVTFFPGGLYAAGWGTSFSTALVSGAAALFEDVRPNFSIVGFQNALTQGAPLDPSLGLGKARLDLVRAGNAFIH